jgi:hypothetical protein
MKNNVDEVRSFTWRGGLLTVMASALIGGHAIAATDSSHKKDDTPCFYITQWQGWKAPDANTLYLGVNLHDVYKVELSAGSPQLLWPDATLISQVRGPTTICRAIDLQLSVTDQPGFRVPLIAKKLTKLTPAEVAAIPKKYLPN